MVWTKQRAGFVLGIWWVLLSVTGCMDQEPVRSEEVLVRIGDRVATVADFNRDLEIAESAYSHSTLQDPVVFKEIRLGVLNQTIEEMILLEIARSHDIRISEAEVEAAVSAIKADYPPGMFEQVLLESAVSFESWKRKLKIRLLAEKVAETVLGDRIVITAEDIAGYYKKHYRPKRLKSGDLGADADVNERIIKHLRREKTEKAYASWMKTLKKEMPIEVNRKLWAKIIGSNRGPEKKSG